MGPSPSAGTSDQSLQLGRYRVIEEVSRTAGSVVYKARDPLIDRLVMVKTLAVGLPHDEVTEFRKRVDRELKSAGRLNHPNIVTIYDVGFADDIVYIATEFIDGRSLREMLRSGARPTPARAAEIAAQIADGLDFVHERGLVHRNISPDTIMVLRNGAVKITDFGIARPSRGQHTLIAHLSASPRYTSPEQVTGERVDERSDIFSLGAVLYELLTGTAPFAAGRLHEVAYEVVNKMPPPPSTCTRGVAPAFDSIVEKALAKHSHDRYRTAREMAADLRTAVKSSPVAEAESASDAAEASSTALRAWRRQPFLLYGACAVLAVATVVMALSRQPSGALPPAPALTPTVASSVATTIEHRDPVSPATSSPDASTPSRAETASVKEGSVSASTSTARLTLAIRPWGIVYVNGKKKGLSPPIKELLLAPGTYIVEIRNDRFPPYRESVDLRRGLSAKIGHSFGDPSNEAAKEGASRPTAARQRTPPLLSEEWPR
jgi:serine/threonine-protein kinase